MERNELEARIDRLFEESDLAIHALYNLMIDRIHKAEEGPAEAEPTSSFSE